ncbi:U4/U6.U5 tri-snRNP-associated protein 2 [Amphibalanus amphitrite]|uniref:ubiquitinyl hydrolase 1 n=1 Tax=Amphibalanus amphitrite TaxID=1232801 RepID=A0A6A4WNR5_AMPAM|nr:U4/U6.U5 tri-snRNP-associated protein 2 [Amphibalanus amphitrite]KAF0309017.1 U4/U6.U5 tri-snRNP-associated protein 2 [Amphibalanus amphitrite]
MSEILEAPAKKPKLQEEDEQDGSEPSALKKKTPETKQAKECPYLDTINRHVLDFDFEKLCSVSLSRINVYACLVCGKYFQGRGLSTHAYTHSVSEGHHVFLNLQTLKFYCLPDQYEIIDSSLEDIKYVLNPTFERSAIARLDTQESLSRAYDGSNYLPGTVGLNNIKANDYCNVIFQALSNVVPIRDYFLDESNYSGMKPPPGDNMFLLVQRFGELVRKLWNPRNFKAHVSPHEMLQAVVLCSKKRFQFTDQGDPVTFLSWFLNALHMALGGTKKRNSSIIYKAFQGRMRVYSRRMPPEDLTAEQKKELLETPEYQETREEMPFLYLTADLPAPPLFRDELKENIIPQVSLFTLLNKFNGKEEKEYKTYKEEIVKRFELTRLPPYLILCIKRFTKNTFFVEKNPTIVNFPIKGTGRWYELQDLHVRDILPQMITLTESYIQIYELRQTPADKS